MKHLLYEQQNSLSELKAEGVVSTKLLQKEHADLETQLHKDLRSLKVELKEQGLSSEIVLKNLQLVCKYLEETSLYNNSNSGTSDLSLISHMIMLIVALPTETQ